MVVSTKLGLVYPVFLFVKYDKTVTILPVNIYIHLFNINYDKSFNKGCGLNG